MSREVAGRLHSMRTRCEGPRSICNIAPRLAFRIDCEYIDCTYRDAFGLTVERGAFYDVAGWSLSQSPVSWWTHSSIHSSYLPRTPGHWALPCVDRTPLPPQARSGARRTGKNPGYPDRRRYSSPRTREAPSPFAKCIGHPSSTNSNETGPDVNKQSNAGAAHDANHRCQPNQIQLRRHA